MRIKCLSVLALYATVVVAGAGAEIVDRIVAVVEGKAVTQSEAIESANVRAFQERRAPVENLSGGELREISDRLIDRKLLESAAADSPFSPPEGGGAQNAMEEIEARYASGEQMEIDLARFHLDRDTLAKQLDRQYAVLAFVDYRLRPQVLLNPAMLEEYYRDTFVPEFHKSAGFGGRAEPPGLEAVVGEIERILTEKEINRLLNAWLHDLRVRARIKLLPGIESISREQGGPERVSGLMENR